MEAQDRDAITTIALIAALADGRRNAQEVAQLERIAGERGGRGDYGPVARQVLSGQVGLAEVVARLSDAEARRTAYEMAAVVCHADGVTSPAEKTFLADLKTSLGLDEAQAAPLDRTAHGLVAAPPSVPAPEPITAPDVDDVIMQTAILTGALELLPQGLAALAIVPIQTRMVYRIGTEFGQKLDGQQIADLAAVMGIGAAAQVFEGTARRVLGGVTRSVLGGLAGSVASAATSGGLTFATTYAMGHAARRYYAEGRALSNESLRELFVQLQADAAGLYPKVEASIRSQARTLDLPRVLSQLRGGT